MLEWFKDFFSNKDVFARSVRAVSLGAAAAALTPEGQAALSQLGPMAQIAVPVAGALLGGGTAVGSKK